MDKHNLEEINRIKKELNFYYPETHTFKLPKIQSIDKSFPRKVVGKIRRELAKSKAGSKFVPKGPSRRTKSKAKSICKNLNFRTYSEPKVSIVIPIFNKFELTVGCLESLKLNLPKDIKTEIVIVNNNSSDESHEYISKIKGIKYINNSENLGFVDGCNVGAKKSEGDFIIFLNNDTSVSKYWLENLLKTIESSNSIGIVGSKLIFPSGLLQEAGGVIFNDGSGANYGKYDHPGDYKYNYLREVDYCSAASIIISRKLFMDLGMFDKLYAPAYYEDTDLAFKVRKSGKKVVYQPKSIAFHLEGATAGTDTSSGFKKFQDINHKKFLNKWSKELKKQYSPELLYKARDRKNEKLALIVDEHVPRIDEDSGSVRMYRIIQSLQKLGYKVTFFPNYTGYTGWHVDDLQQKGVEIVYGNIKFNDFIKSYGSFYDLVMLSRPRIASFYMDICRIYAPRCLLIYDTVDLHYLRMNRQAEIEKDSQKKITLKLASKYEKLEKFLIDQSDKTFVVSTYEKDLLRSDGFDNVEILSNIHEIDVDSYKIGFKNRKDILFIGGYSHNPNIDAVEWFCKDMFPKIRKKLPEIKFHIVGSKMPVELRSKLEKIDGVIVHGFVEDKELKNLLRKTKIFVAPLRFGAGVKGKIGQSIEFGIPVVSTEIGIEGMGLVNNTSCLEANNPKKFIDSVIKLNNNEKLWSKIQTNARKILVENFSADKAYRDIKKII